MYLSSVGIEGSFPILFDHQGVIHFVKYNLGFHARICNSKIIALGINLLELCTEAPGDILADVYSIILALSE